MATTTSRPLEVGPGVQRQLPSFIAVGLFGLVVDSGATYALVHVFGADPFLARFPAFALATVLNFCLNRFLTFRASRVPLARAFWRYLVVCAFGFGVNFCAYAAALKVALWLGLGLSDAYLPVFVAWGAGCAMFVTFFGYRFYAFKL